MAKYKNPTPGDLLVHEESAIVCREETVVTNQTAAEITMPVGTPIDSSGNVVLATAEASAVGLILENVLLPASGATTFKVGYIARGPCAINRDKIAATDTAGTSYNVANIVTALEALGMTFRDEPTVQSEQIN